MIQERKKSIIPNLSFKYYTVELAHHTKDLRRIKPKNLISIFLSLQNVIKIVFHLNFLNIIFSEVQYISMMENKYAKCVMT